MRDARVELEFADGDYSFRLGWGQLIELQEKTLAGPYVVLQRLLDKSFLIDDVAETIRIGLIGGGMEPGKALTMTKRYVKARPPFENLTLATAILMAGLMGAPDEEVGAGRKADSDKAVKDDGKLPVAALYGNGAIMGFTPQEVNAMTIWQFVAAWEGYAKHHSGADEKMSDKESAELFEWLQEFTPPE